MNYTKTYIRIIDYFKNNPASPCEKHHIIPKCLGGMNDKENIVRLSPRAHFVCHMLLVKMCEGNLDAWERMMHALWFMMNQHKDSYRFTSIRYEQTKLATRTPEARRKFSVATKKVWQDPVRRAKMLASIRTPAVHHAKSLASSIGIKKAWQNTTYREKHTYFGERNPKATATDECVRQIRRSWNEFDSSKRGNLTMFCNQYADIHNITPNVVYYIVKGVTWKHVV